MFCSLLLNHDCNETLACEIPKQAFNSNMLLGVSIRKKVTVQTLIDRNTICSHLGHTGENESHSVHYKDNPHGWCIMLSLSLGQGIKTSTDDEAQYRAA